MQPAPSCSAPYLLGVDASIWATSLLGVAIRCVICGFYLFIHLFFLLVMLPSESPKLPRPAGERVSWCLETSPLLRFPRQNGSPSLFVSLFIFYILSYLLWKTMGCLFRSQVSSASVQRLFCGIYSAFKLSFDE